MSEFVPLTNSERANFEANINAAVPVKPKAALRYFTPLEDISVYELAQIVAAAPLNAWGSMADKGLLFDDDIWNELPDTIKRHWSET